MEITQTFLLNITVLPLTLLTMCVMLPLYWIYNIISFIVRSFYPENVNGKVVIITGASSGIGEHVAYEYAKRGARLALVARRKDRLLIVAKKAKEFGCPDTLVISTDISVPENCEEIVQKTIHHFGRVDHLVNNAGINSSKYLEEYIDIQEMNDIMNINFWGAVHTTRYAMGHIRKNKGKIVVVSSSAYYIPFPRLSIYSASKGALVSLFDTMRLEFGQDIHITLVIPGAIESEMTTISKNLQTGDAAQATNEWWIDFVKKSRFPMEKVEVCAQAIVRSVCRGDKYLIEPKWVLSTYYTKVFWPEMLEFTQRLLMIDFCKKYM